MFPISSILWPSDGSPHSYKALDAAVEIAEKFKADIYALQVVQQVPTLSGTGFAPVTMSGFDVLEYEEALIKAAEKELYQSVAERVPREIKVISRVTIGAAADMIVEYAKEHSIDLIVMATHGRTGISHMVLGSVAEKTIRQSPIATLVIPPTSDK